MNTAHSCLINFAEQLNKLLYFRKSIVFGFFAKAVSALRELASVKGETISGVRGVSPEVYGEYRSHRDVLASFSRDFELLKLVLDGHEDFRQGLIDAGGLMAGEVNIINQNHLHMLTFKTSRLMLNLLGAVRTFLDHAQTSVSRRYGGASEQLAFFKSLTAFQFDNVFSYRFLYKLRNYTQHCGMPPVGYSVDIVPDDSLSMNLHFIRRCLLDEYKEWGSVVKKELESSEEPLSVLGLLNEHVNSVVGIFLDFYDKYNREDVGRSKSWMCEFLSDLSPDDKYCFLDAEPKEVQGAEGVSFKIEWVPTFMVRDVLWVEEQLRVEGRM